MHHDEVRQRCTGQCISTATQLNCNIWLSLYIIFALFNNDDDALEFSFYVQCLGFFAHILCKWHEKYDTHNEEWKEIAYDVTCWTVWDFSNWLLLQLWKTGSLDERPFPIFSNPNFKCCSLLTIFAAFFGHLICYATRRREIAPCGTYCV